MKHFKIILISVLLIGCQKAIEIDRDSVKPKLVINCIISPDKDTVKLSLSESRDLLYDQGNFPVVTNASVALFENGTKLNNFIFMNGTYILPYQVKAGANYRIEATSEGFDDVNAETVVKSIFSDLIFEAERLENNSIHGSLLINDKVNEENYFQVKMQYGEKIVEDTSMVVDTSFGWQNYNEQWLNSYCCTNDYIIEYPQSDLLQGSNCNDKFMFSDRTFENGVHTLKLFSEPNINYYYNDDAEILAVIECLSLNKDYFSYIISRSIFFNNFGNPFAEPVPVYNNIVNGYGIFGSVSTYLDTLVLE